MKIVGLREVSLAAPSIADVAAGLAAITGHAGFEVQEEPVPPIQARFQSYAVGDRSIAVMESLGRDTAITRFLAKRGAGTFSMTFEVADVDAAAAHLRAQGARLVLDEPLVLRDVRSGARRFDRMRINFVSPVGPMHGLVVELQELHGAHDASGAVPSARLDIPVALNELHCAVRDVGAAAKDLGRLLGFEVGPAVVQAQPPEEVRYHNLYVGDRPVLALIEPATSTSSIHRFLARRGEGVFTISMRVPDGRAYYKRLREAGLEFLFETPKHVHHARIGPLELTEAGIQWIKPQPASNRVLFEIQEYRS
jgi:methylmalonyl-CoA/ethylmalonyl-CoA epimerase